MGHRNGAQCSNRQLKKRLRGFLREADAGLPVKELCRKHGFSEPNYYA